MPTLPTFSVTQANADRIQAAFGSPANYKAAVRQLIRQRVLDYESEQIQSQRQSELEAKVAEIAASLDDTSLQ